MQTNLRLIDKNKSAFCGVSILKEKTTPINNLFLPRAQGVNRYFFTVFAKDNLLMATLVVNSFIAQAIKHRLKRTRKARHTCFYAEFRKCAAGIGRYRMSNICSVQCLDVDEKLIDSGGEIPG